PTPADWQVSVHLARDHFWSNTQVFSWLCCSLRKRSSATKVCPASASRYRTKLVARIPSRASSELNTSVSPSQRRRAWISRPAWLQTTGSPSVVSSMEKVSWFSPRTWVRVRRNRGSRCSITNVVESGTGICSELLLRLNLHTPEKLGFAIGSS